MVPFNEIAFNGCIWRRQNIYWEPFSLPCTLSHDESVVFLLERPQEEKEMDSGNTLSLFPNQCSDGLLPASFSNDVRRSTRVLRKFILEHCFQIPLTTLVVERSPGQGTYFKSEALSLPLYFSQSHTTGCAMLVFSPYPCGVDVELIRDPDAYPVLIRRGLPRVWRESLELFRNEPQSQAELFTVYWTALESRFKREGGDSFLKFLRGISSVEDIHSSLVNWSGDYALYFTIDDAYVSSLNFAQKPTHPCFIKIFYHDIPLHR